MNTKAIPQPSHNKAVLLSLLFVYHAYRLSFSFLIIESHPSLPSLFLFLLPVQSSSSHLLPYLTITFQPSFTTMVPSFYTILIISSSTSYPKSHTSANPLLLPFLPMLSSSPHLLPHYLITFQPSFINLVSSSYTIFIFY